MAAPNAAEDTCSLQKYFGGTCDHPKHFSFKDCNKTITGHLRYCKLGWKPGLKCGFPGHPVFQEEETTTWHDCKDVRASSAKMGLPMQIGHRQCLDEVSDTCTSEFNPGIDLSNNLQEDILKFGEANNMSNDRSEKSDIRDDQKVRPQRESNRFRKTKEQSNTEELRDLTQNSQTSQSIGLSQDSQISNWSDDVGMHTLNRINTALVSIKESTLRYIKRKANQSVDCVMEAIAPGQGVAVKKIFLREMKNPHDQNVVQTDLVQEILQLYNATTDNMIRRQLLALISNQLSKQELMRAIPDLRTYRIDQAKLDITTAF
ncbi:unnamed protein product [Mytilus coruscus]|uniref:Uncharacterized protein n=1 Tax=Mytilus coruscus TaxID=42192 RepID=A0A6J7ZX65_MYTCO|nr:unnamed protein product [Mytilus coruscus]